MNVPLIEFIKRTKYDLGTHVEIESSWSSENKDNRDLIRQGLIRSLRNGGTDLGKEDEEHLRDLNKVPCSAKYSVSISHCQIAGGFAISRDSKSTVGFDLERRDRISQKIVGRISYESEVTHVPNHEMLWTIKEASFKCVSNSDPTLIETLSGIEVTSATNISTWNYRGILPIEFLAQSTSKDRQLKLSGLAGIFGDLCIAVARTFSST